MDNYTRLFDIPIYQKANFSQQKSLSYKYDGKWKHYSTDDCLGTVNRVSRALLKLGIQPDDKLALISSNRPEWNFIDVGMLQVGAVNVPIYPTISESDYKFIFNDSQIKIAFVEDQDLYEKIKNIQPEVPSLQKIYSIEKLKECDCLEEFLKLGDYDDEGKVEQISSSIDAMSLATIIYTSGTTGTPKGVMLSHNNIVSNIQSVTQVLPFKAGESSLSFLPLCHIFERVVVYTYMAEGINIFYADSIDTLSDDLKDVKPNYFSTVPRLLEKVYDKIIAKGMALTGLKKKLFFWAVDLAKDYKENEPLNFKRKIADKLIYSKWREAIGGEVIGIMTGAAALQERLARIFNAAGINVREGYGQTESSPVVSFNRFFGGDMKFGSVGTPIPGVEVKLGDSDEILVRGPNVMMGYYNRPDLTAQTIKDGWLHTGDVGKWVDGKFLKITDRVKELFKTSGGKYVAPQVIENKMKESIYIEQICVTGENQKFVGALIVPSFLNLSEWCTKNAVSADNNEAIVNSPDVQQLFQDEIDKLNVNFGKVEKVKRFKLMADEWSIDSGELTPTMKVKRKVVAEKYAKEIANIYAV